MFVRKSMIMNKGVNMRRYFKYLFIAVVAVCCLSGCKNNPEEKLQNIEVSEIEKIECKGNTGGKDGSFSYCIPKENYDDFAELLGRVKLGEKVDRNSASSSGASKFFTVYFTDGQSLKFSPMYYFYLDGTYYEFENYGELSGSFGELR